MNCLLLTTASSALVVLPAFTVADIMLLLAVTLALLIGVLLVTWQLLLHLRQHPPGPAPEPGADEPALVAAVPSNKATQEAMP